MQAGALAGLGLTAIGGGFVRSRRGFSHVVLSMAWSGLWLGRRLILISTVMNHRPARSRVHFMGCGCVSQRRKAGLPEQQGRAERRKQ